MSQNTSDMATAKTIDSAHIEDAVLKDASRDNVVGTTKLLDKDDIILQPAPTSAPRDPLNLPPWRKVALVVNVSIFAATATLIASSFGAILPVINEEYDNDPRVNDLVTFPALFIGLGNFIFVPIAHAIGRRPIYLFSLIMLVACCIWCAFSKSLDSHIAGRDMLSLAAGQAEALCPIMVQEVHFLHERASMIAWFCAAQVLGTALLTISSSYLATDLGWRWWYGVFAIINGVCLISAVFLVVETKFDRKELEQEGESGSPEPLKPITSRSRPQLDYNKHPARTLRHDLAIIHGKPRWQDAVDCWKQMLQVVFFPNIFWLLLSTGVFLGVFVIAGAVFAGILVAPPYNFGSEVVGFVFAGQVVVSLVVVPAQGYLSDYLVKWLSKRHDGVAEPEYRLLTLIPPFIVGIISAIIFGHACEHPENWHWSAIVVTFSSGFFAFVGTVVAGFTYCIDSYPARSDATLVVLCFARGVVSFGMSYGSLKFVAKEGYDGAFDICAIIMGVLAALGIPVYAFGKRIRKMTQPWAVDTA